jgi:hypothetical protein
MEMSKLKFIKIFPPGILFAVLITGCSLHPLAQSKENGLLNQSDKFNLQRFNTVLISEAAFATLTTICLNSLWYKKFPKSRFHFFNDNKEWLNMDKVGHATTAYNISAAQYNAMRWSGVKTEVSALIGGMTGLAYLGMIEIMDGFSSQWGFSKGDMLANILGSALFTGQQYLWDQQRIQLRFSYHKTIYPHYNPGELGENWLQRIIKDYNGQTYWLSFLPATFFKSGSRFPKWVTLDAGYGADGMTGALYNPVRVDDKPVPPFTRKRKFFLGASVAFLKKNEYPFPSWINLFEFPTPALEVDRGFNKKLQFHPYYF